MPNYSQKSKAVQNSLILLDTVEPTYKCREWFTSTPAE